jgi:hypothetical protein
VFPQTKLFTQAATQAATPPKHTQKSAPGRRQAGDELQHRAQQKVQVGDAQELLKEVDRQEREQRVLGRRDLVGRHVAAQVHAERLGGVVQRAALHGGAAHVRLDQARRRLVVVVVAVLLLLLLLFVRLLRCATISIIGPSRMLLLR